MEYIYSTEPLTAMYQYKGLVSIVPALCIGLISAGPAAVAASATEDEVSPLSPREEDVLREIARGLSNKEIARTRDELITPAELSKLKAQIETEYVNSNSRVEGIAESLASAHTFLGGTARLNTELNEYLALTAADMQRVAKQYFVKENRVVLYYLPQSQQKN